MLAGVVLGAAAEVAIPNGRVSTYLGKASVLGLLAAAVVGEDGRFLANWSERIEQGVISHELHNP